MRDPNQLEQQPRDCVVEMKIDRISKPVPGQRSAAMYTENQKKN